MKKSLSLAIAFGLSLCAASLFTGCSSTGSSDSASPGTYYGPSTENTPNYTEQMRSYFRNNW